MRPGVVINADDLGRTSNVNRAIIESFDKQLISSASIMPNMPAFAEALEMVHSGALADRVGVHLNVTAGSALSEPIREIARFCDRSGQFKPRERNLWHLSPSEELAVELEYAAQVEAVIAGGIHPTHLDSHQHFHTQWPILPILIRLARRYEVPAIRLSRNCGPIPSAAKRAYKQLFNARLIHSGLAPTRHFGSAADTATLTGFAGAVEVMVHPELDHEGRIVDVPMGGHVVGADLLALGIAHWLTSGPIVSFADLGAV
jgi:chitin disaccharide deacetylase